MDTMPPSGGVAWVEDEAWWVDTASRHTAREMRGSWLPLAAGRWVA
jgi:hypothetical protein